MVSNELVNIGMHPRYPYLLIKQIGSVYSHNITYDPAESMSDAYRRMAETKDLMLCIICKVEERFKRKESDAKC